MVNMRRVALIVAVTLAMAAGAGGQAKKGGAPPKAASKPAAVAAEPVQYELRFGQPNTHLLEITIHATGLRGPAVEFAMPAWAPGAYSINDYAKMVQGFAAQDASGKTLAWRKTDKQTWRVETGGAAALTVRYTLYGNTLAGNWVQYNDKHAHISGPAAWMYLVGGKQRPVRLTMDAPAGWKVATGMQKTGENAYQAADYDWFADSPIEIADFAEKTFTFARSTYHVVVHDVLGGKDFSRVTQDTQKIVEAIVPMYAEAREGTRPAPYEEYWFLLHVWPAGFGGLEHLNSTQITFGTAWDSTLPAGVLTPDLGRFGTDYNLKLFVIAHEFYHAWNVKRLRPKPLGPFDYSREAHTPSLWISEGLTSYNGELALVRAGLVKPEQYLDSIGRLITSFEAEPGRAERSIEDTSWDTWFKNLPPGDTNLQNTNYSYYDGGQVAGHLLDFAIRQATNNQKSLDDWMRLMYSRYALPKPGFEPADAIRAASELAGKDMSDFFRRYITGKEPLPYETYFGYAGIGVEKKVDAEKRWLGVSLNRQENGWAMITGVVPGGPAQKAGLDKNDVILSLEGKAVGMADFMKALDAKKPGDVMKLTIGRMGERREISVTPGADPKSVYTLKPSENPTELQKKIYDSWLSGRR